MKRIRTARARARRAAANEPPGVLLGPAAIPDLEAAGLNVSPTRGGSRRGLFAGHDPGQQPLVELVPLGPTGWSATIAEGLPEPVVAEMRAVLSDLGRLDEPRRAAALSAHLSPARLRDLDALVGVAKHGKQVAGRRDGVPDERLTNPPGVVQGGAPGLRQQRR